MELYIEKIIPPASPHNAWRELVLDTAFEKLGFVPEIHTHKNGKPYIPGLHFNISHSYDYLVCAFADSSVGVDIEKIRPMREKVAERFHSEEKKRIENAPDKDLEFFKIWTMKEAYLKCLGVGLTKNLESFNVFDIPNMHTEIRDGYVISICKKLGDI